MSLHIHNPHHQAGITAPGITLVPPPPATPPICLDDLYDHLDDLADRIIASMPSDHYDEVKREIAGITTKLNYMSGVMTSVLSAANDIELSAEAREKDIYAAIVALAQKAAAPAPAPAPEPAPAPVHTIERFFDSKPDQASLDLIERLIGITENLAAQVQKLTATVTATNASIWMRLGRFLGLI